IGVSEAVFAANSAPPGLSDLVLFLVILVLTLWRRPSIDSGSDGWSLSPRVPPVPRALAGVWWIRRLGLLTGAVALLVAACLPLVFDSSASVYLFTRVLIFALI